MHIHEFQEMMKELYYPRDLKRGVRANYAWLIDEVRELGEALEEINKDAIEKEFADVIAWLASLANVAGVDLEKAALEKYPNKCPKCKHSPCKCTYAPRRF